MDDPQEFHLQDLADYVVAADSKPESERRMNSAFLWMVLDAMVNGELDETSDER